MGSDRMFERLLHELSVVFFDVVMGSDRMFELISHHHSRSLGRWTTDEEHNPTSALVVRSFQERNGHGQSHARRTQGTHALIDGPRIPLQLAEEIRQTHVAFAE